MHKNSNEESKPSPRFVVRSRNESSSSLQTAEARDGSGSYLTKIPLLRSQASSSRSRQRPNHSSDATEAILFEADKFTPKKQLQGAKAFQNEFQSISQQRLDVYQDISPGLDKEVYEPLLRLRDILTRYEYLDKLPKTTAIYAELAKPFLYETPQVEACCLALGTMKRIFETYGPSSSMDTLVRWKWCCNAMMVDFQDFFLVSITPPLSVRHSGSAPAIAILLTTGFLSTKRA